MKKIIFFLAVLICNLSYTWAQTYYGISVAGVKVTSANASNITGPNISGNISYDRFTNVLWVRDANINGSAVGAAGIKSNANLTIHFSGTCKVQGVKGIEFVGDGLNRITGSGLVAVSGTDIGIDINVSTLEISSLDITVDSPNWGIAGIGGTTNFEYLIVKDANLKSRGIAYGSIGNISSLTLTMCEIVSPVGGAYNSLKRGVVKGQENNITREWVNIVRTSYPLWIAGTQVHKGNAANITGDGIKGTVSYDEKTNTLTLNKATLTDVKSSEGEGENVILNYIKDKTLNIKLIGSNTLDYTGSGNTRGIYGYSYKIMGTGSLLVDVYSSHSSYGFDCIETLTIAGGIIKMRNMDYGIAVSENAYIAGGKLEINSRISAIQMWKSTNPTLSVYSNSLKYQGITWNDPQLVHEFTFRTEGNYMESLPYLKIIPGANYQFAVAGVLVTSENASNITGAGITGKVSYNSATNTLTLDNAQISISGETNAQGIETGYRSPDNLKINLVGVNRINHTSSYSKNVAVYLRRTTTFQGTGSLSVYNSNNTAILVDKTLSFEGGCTVSVESATQRGIHGGNTDSSLRVINSTLKSKSAASYSISGFSSFVASGTSITAPKGAVFSSSLKGIALNGNLVKSQWVEIKPVTVTNYDIKVAGTQVTSANASKIEGTGISGHVSYNHVTNTLTLNNARISISGVNYNHGIESGTNAPDYLKINLIGTNSINHTGSVGLKRAVYLRKSTTFLGAGSLSIYRGSGPAMHFEGNTLTFDGGCKVTAESPTHTGLRGSSGAKLRVLNSSLKVKGSDAYSIGGFDSFFGSGTSITSPAGAVFSSSLQGIAVNGALVKNQWVVIEPATVSKYELWIAGMQVDEYNKADILGDGSVNYDSNNKVLTLNEASIVITGEDVDEEMPVRSSIDGLTILVKGNNVLKGAEYMDGLSISGNKTTIKGPGSLFIEGGHENVGLDFSNNLIIQDCALRVKGEEGGIWGNNGTLKIINSTVSAVCNESGYSGSMAGISELEMIGCNILAPQNAEFEKRNAFNGITTDEGRTYTKEEVIIGPEHYDIMIDGLSINQLNAGKITGPNLTGNISFNESTNTLRLENASIISEDVPLITNRRNSGKRLTIELVGNNLIEKTAGTSFAVLLDCPTKITGSGSLNIITKADIGLISSFTPLTITGGCTVVVEGAKYGLVGEDVGDNEILTIDGATVKAKGGMHSIGSYKSIILKGVNITSPPGAVFNSNTGNIELGGKAVTDWVEISSVVNYDLHIAGTQVTSANASKITGAGISGTVSYDPNSNTLKLNNAKITLSGSASTHGIESGPSSLENLKIHLEGTNSINHSGTSNMGRGIYLRKSTTFLGTGSLSVLRNSAEALLINDDKTLSFEGGCMVSLESTTYSGIRGDKNNTLKVINATLKAKGVNYSIGRGFTSFITTGTAITAPSGAEYSSSLKGVALNGALVKNQWVEIKPVSSDIVRYKIWVAGIQVTSANASDITAAIGNPAKASGGISYDAATQTLTLDKAVITYDLTAIASSILCEIPTTIRLKQASVITVNRAGISGIWFKWVPGVITGPGSLEIRAFDDAAIFHPKASLRISGCSLTASGTWGLCGSSGTTSETLTIENATVKVKGKVGSICDISSLNLIGCKITQPVGAAFDTALKGVALDGKLVTDWVVIEPGGTSLPTLASHGIQVHGGRGTIKIEINLPPNPLKGEYLRVFNLNGSLVYSSLLPAGHVGTLTLTPPSGGWEAGIYIVRIGGAAEKVLVK